MCVFLQIVGFSLSTKSVSLLGDGKEKYQALYKTELYKTHVDERLIIHFEDEKELFDFLQVAINEKTPFFHSERSFSYLDALELVHENKLIGEIIKSIWKKGNYIIIEN